VLGPGAGTTPNAVVLFDGTSGTDLKESPATIDVSGNIVTPGAVQAGTDVLIGGQPIDGQNSGSTPAALRGRPYKDRVLNLSRFRTSRSGRQIRIVEGADELLFNHDPSFVMKQGDTLKRRTFSGSKKAGTTLTPNTIGNVNPLVQNGQVVHGPENLHPFMTWTEVDFYGYPHAKYVQMINGNPGDPKQSRGYEAGQKFPKGEFLRRPGRGVRYDVRCLFTSVGWSDVFTEFVLEPNPTCDPAGEFEGAHRMRCVSDELGLSNVTDLLLTFSIELAVHRAKEYSFEGETRIYSADGKLLRATPHGGYIADGFNWLQNDAKLQLRWRVDRIEKLDTYDDEFQGTNQGANTLTLDARRMVITPVGFEDLRDL
jgi:hypothetical protein